LGKNQEAWKEYDSTILLQNANKSQFTSEILIDQGGSDEFLSRGQLLPENFVQAANSIDTNLVKYRLHEGYDHSYYFISTFIEDHIKHHASYLH
jgi:S-formylglutathione hydrolase